MPKCIAQDIVIMDGNLLIYMLSMAIVTYHVHRAFHLADCQVY